MAEGGAIVYTASLTSAAQSPVTVTLSNGATINIAGRAVSSSGTGSVNSGVGWAKATPRLIPAS